MNKIETFEQFLTTQSVQVPILGFVFNLVLAALLSFLLSRVYVKFGNAISNRRAFGSNFVLLTTTTMLIITIVKSSLALSLGLVGALSIVRFRAAIKEPEELSYLFLTIALGLGFGADQRVLTIVAFAVIMGLIMIKNSFRANEGNPNLFLTISSDKADKIVLEDLVKTLKDYCSSIDIKRFDETKDLIEATFIVEYKDYEKLQSSKSALRKLDESMKITFLDNKGIQ